MPITTDVVSSKLDQGEVSNIMWSKQSYFEEGTDEMDSYFNRLKVLFVTKLGLFIWMN
jgi:hypothetical protein